jgi:hypothetical protein
MIVITVYTTDLGYNAVAIHEGTLYVAARSNIMESVARDVVTQLAHRVEDQELVIEYPTVAVQHRSLWALAGIKTRGEQHRFCPACHAPVTAPKSYCNNTCRQRASRARSKRSA